MHCALDTSAIAHNKNNSLNNAQGNRVSINCHGKYLNLDEA